MDDDVINYFGTHLTSELARIFLQGAVSDELLSLSPEDKVLLKRCVIHYLTITIVEQILLRVKESSCWCSKALKINDAGAVLEFALDRAHCFPRKDQTYGGYLYNEKNNVFTNKLECTCPAESGKIEFGFEMCFFCEDDIKMLVTVLLSKRTTDSTLYDSILFTLNDNIEEDHPLLRIFSKMSDDKRVFLLNLLTT
jgi:hypothetical protein